MKKLLAIILAVAMVMSMAVAVSADSATISVGTWTSSTGRLNLSSVLPVETTFVVIMEGTVVTTDNGAASFKLLPLKNGGWSSGAVASSKVHNVAEGTTEVNVAYEFVTTQECGHILLKDFSANVDSVDIDISIFLGTMAEYEASLIPEAPAGDVVIGGVGYDEEVLYTSTSVVDASIEGWGWYNAFEQGTFGSYDAALAALNGTYIKVTHVGSINAPFWQTSDSPNNKTTVFATATGVTYFNSSVLYEDMVALGDKGWGNVVIAGNGGEAETVSKVEIVTLVEVPAVEEEETYRGSGYFMTGDETHAMIIGKAIITSNHEFDEDGDCKYCGHHVDVEVEDIIVEQPTESTEEESEDITVEEPKEDTNPGTGLTLAVIPAIVALAAVVISKR